MHGSSSHSFCLQERMGEAARKALARATTAIKRYGWIGFWVQLTLSVVSAVILLFSVAFTSQVRPPAPAMSSHYLSLSQTRAISVTGIHHPHETCP